MLEGYFLRDGVDVSLFVDERCPRDAFDINLAQVPEAERLMFRKFQRNIRAAGAGEYTSVRMKLIARYTVDPNSRITMLMVSRIFSYSKFYYVPPYFH